MNVVCEMENKGVHRTFKQNLCCVYNYVYLRSTQKVLLTLSPAIACVSYIRTWEGTPIWNKKTNLGWKSLGLEIGEMGLGRNCEWKWEVQSSEYWDVTMFSSLYDSFKSILLPQSATLGSKLKACPRYLS